MIQIRKNVFETNSSSVHSVCIANGDRLINIPSSVFFTFGEFGWEVRTLYSVEEKASYLYQAIFDTTEDNEWLREKYIENIKQFCENNGVECDFQEYSKDVYGYIDHPEDLNVFVDTVCSDEYMFLKYLFSPDSFIRTANDNSDYGYFSPPSGVYTVFEKGN